MQTLFNRITCKYFGHTIYGGQYVFNLVPYSRFVDGSWKELITSCDRCHETQPSTEFPIFLKISDGINSILIAEEQRKDIVEKLRI